MRDKVEAVLEEIRPALMADDANVQLIDVSNGIVKVKLTGVCGGVLYSKYELATRN